MDEAILRMASAAMSNPNSVAHEVAKKLNISTATLYTYVNGDGSIKDAGLKQIHQKHELSVFQT